MTEVGEIWVPEECTLPTVDRPLRLSEFDGLFATSLREVSRISPTVLRWVLDPAAEQVARDLTARETECCSFFSFGFSTASDAIVVDVQVPSAQVVVLDALAARGAGMKRR